MVEKIRSFRIPVGLRTVKTAVAVMLSLVIVEHYGASPAKVVFATIGAMSAVGPTFKASVRSCLTQICGVAIGGALAICMTQLYVPNTISVGFGIVLIITVWHADQYPDFPL